MSTALMVEAILFGLFGIYCVFWLVRAHRRDKRREAERQDHDS